MNLTLKTTLAACALVLGSQAMAQITFYEAEGFRGRAMTTDRAIENFDRTRFNDRASSVVVERGRWEVCEDARFRGRCVVLRRGNYDSLRSVGMENRISSVRRIENNRRYANEPEPVAGPVYEYRQRPNERTYEVPVTSARAVVGPPNQRCWVERQQVQGGGQPNVGGAVIGGLIGGILGHQVGGGSGKDIATAGGAVAGAVIGANQGQGSTYPRDVQRCETVANATPAYWDVTYNYRGVEHRVQMAAAPGPTIIVNGNGEPRQ
jgi:uncharacterized protein YcfJ